MANNSWKPTPTVISVSRDHHAQIAEYADTLGWTRKELVEFVFKHFFDQISIKDIKRVAREMEQELVAREAARP